MNKALKQLRNNRGLTLVEILVTVFIFSLISAAIFTIINVSNDSWQMNKASVELQQQLRKGMDWMMNDLREAGTTSIIDVPADGTWYTAITFQTPSGISSGSISWDATTINFALGGTRLLRTYGATVNILATDISLLQFRRQAASADILEVSLRAQRAVPGGVTLQRDLTFDVQLRN